MIFDRLDRGDNYLAVAPRLAAAFAFLRQPQLAELTDGRYPLDGERLFALVQRYHSRPEALAGWEAHRRYIDLQFLVSGCERIGVAPRERLVAGSYDADRDLQPLSGDGDWLTLQAGDFLLLFPHDAHRPCVAVDTPSAVHKVVVKIAVTPSA